MSLATMKKKSRTLRGGVSQGKNGFSLYGTTRLHSGSAVGADSFNRSTIGTRFKGAVPRGHGGSNGKYTQKVATSGRCCTVSNTVQPSTVSTRGMLDRRLRCCTYGVYPNQTVKQQSTMDYGRYIKAKTSAAGGNVMQKQDSGIKTTTCATGDKGSCGNKLTLSKRMNYTKDVGPMDHNTYIQTKYLKNKCMQGCSIPIVNSTVLVNSSGVITSPAMSATNPFIVGGTYTFYFTAGNISLIHNIPIDNTSISATITISNTDNVIIEPSSINQVETYYPIFNTGALNCGC